MGGILLLTRATHQLVDVATAKQSQVLMKPGVEHLMKQGHLLLVRVNMVGPIWREVVKSLTVLVDTVGALLQVQKLLQLAGHEARGDVVPTESLPKLSPQDSVAIPKSGSVFHPPCTCGPHKAVEPCVESYDTLCSCRSPNLDSIVRSQLSASSGSDDSANVRCCVTKKST
jgi:hypothetical protein